MPNTNETQYIYIYIYIYIGGNAGEVLGILKIIFGINTRCQQIDVERCTFYLGYSTNANIVKYLLIRMDVK